MVSLQTAGIVLFILGLILTGIELSMPGFGVFGITGIASLGLSVLFLSHSFVQGILLVLLIFVLLALMLIAFLRFFGRNKFTRPVVLEDEVGAKAASASGQDLIGLTGTAVCDLHPAGKGLFGEQTLDILSEGKFIPQGAEIKIVQFKNGRPVVRQHYGAR